MLIRSQDKEMIINFDTICRISILGKPDPSEECIVCVDGLTLGEYSDRKKAVKVLDMIQGAYADAKLNEILLPDVCKSASESQRGKDNTLIAKTIRKDFMKKMIFQMPEDSEVEA